MRLDTSFLVGVWLEALVYGVYVVAFAVCLRLFRTHALVVGRALPIWLGALFALATAHCALSLSAVLDAFIRFTYPDNRFPPSPMPSPMPGPGGSLHFYIRPQEYHDPSRYISNRALPTNLAAFGVYAGVVLLSDLMLLYRLLVMYRYRFIWVVGPALLVVASFVVSMIAVSKYAHIDPGAESAILQKQLEDVSPWLPPTYAIAFLANLATSTLMMAKTSFISSKTQSATPIPAFARRRHTHQNSLSAGDGFVFDIDERTGPVPGTSVPTPVRRKNMTTKWVLLAGIVESGALAPIFMLVALILYVSQDGQETLLVPMLAPLAALIPTLQIIQLQLGLDSTARNRPVSIESERGLAGSTSPYLVPAPRYHDSSSEEEDNSDGEGRLVNGRKNRPRRSDSSSRPTAARRLSAQLGSMWAWRGRASGSGSGSGSHSKSNSQSGSSGREEPLVMLQMRDLAGSGERAGDNDTKARNIDGEDDVWERIKLDDSKPHVPGPRPSPPVARRSTLRKSIAKDMISKPVPIAADFPPTTANIPSTAIAPTLPNFTFSAEAGLTNGELSRKPSSEHKYHYRVRPREKTASPLVAYLSAQALAQADERERPPQFQQPPVPSSSGQPPSNLQPMSLPSTTPTSPASGFTSLDPHSASKNPFRFETHPELHVPHKPLPESSGLGGVGLLGAQRVPLSDPEASPVPRWAAVPGGPRIHGLDTFFPPGHAGAGRHGQVNIERDTSPAPGLQRDYSRAREEVLRQMRKDKGGMLSDDESVYSTQMLANAGRR